MTTPSDGKIRAALERLKHVAKMLRVSINDIQDRRMAMENIGALDAELEALSSPPEPIGGEASDNDGTDAAHPAYWRGSDDAIAGLCAQINRMLDGEAPAGTAREPWEGTRQRLAAIIPEGEAVRVAISAMTEVDRWMLVITAAVNRDDRPNYDGVLEAMQGNRAALTALRRSGEGV